MQSTSVTAGAPTATTLGMSAISTPPPSRSSLPGDLDIDRAAKGRAQKPLISERTRERAASSSAAGRRSTPVSNSRLLMGFVIGLQLLGGGAHAHVGNMAALAGLPRNKALAQLEVPSDQDFIGHGYAEPSKTDTARSTSRRSAAPTVPRRRAQEDLGIFRDSVETAPDSVSPSPRPVHVKRVGRSSFGRDRLGRNLHNAEEDISALVSEGVKPPLTDLDRYDYSLFAFNEDEPEIRASVGNGHSVSVIQHNRPAGHRSRSHRKIDGPSKSAREKLPLRYAGR